MQESRLHTGIGFKLKRFLILPSDVQARQHPHDTDRTITFALLAGGLVFSGIPCVGNSSRFGVEGEIEIVAFRGSYHPVCPVVGNQRNPISREINRGSRLGGSGGLGPGGAGKAPYPGPPPSLGHHRP